MDVQKCSNKKHNKLNNTFISQSNKIHNNKYTYVEEYKGSHTSIGIKCPKHGIFKQTPNSHLRGRGCPECQWSNSSKMEKAWLDMMGIAPEFRKSEILINNKRYKVDAYNPKTNTIYEFYGDFWHGNPQKYTNGGSNLKNKSSFSDLYERTIKREEFLKSQGFNVITIWESEFLKMIKQSSNK
jgi:G:T-mismatch repair DNA endonuclease (very short patch repair protein)